MEKTAFIQQHLAEKGIPKDLTKFNTNLWSVFLFAEVKPLVFQSPIKVFFKQGVVFGAMWGLLMWLFIWHSAPEGWMIQLVSALLFGCVLGGLSSYRIVKAHKKLDNMSWEKWCSANYESAP